MPIKNLTLGFCTLLACSTLAHGGQYRVRNGDFDWAIAKRHDITVYQLHKLNPNVNWDALRVGSTISVPGGGSESHGHRVASRHHSSSSRIHRVAEGENDWIIAHRAGTTLTVLRELNPDVKLSLLQPGQKIRVPGAASADVPEVHRIRSTRVAVNSDNVTIRRGPGTDHDSICTVDGGTHAAVLDRRGDWYQLEFPKGTVGWVRGDFLKAVHVQTVARSEHHSHRHHSYVAMARPRRHRHGGEHSSASEYTAMDSDAGANSEPLLERAKSMRGTRYHWGEASRSGTDCSGFTSQVFRTQGVHLPRTSVEQAHVGQKVGYKDLRPGDLVFFHTVRGHRVSHVGIYMGHGQFIHASSAGGQVQVNSLSGYYADRLVAARRVATAHSAKK
jgi:cell wall-associated NlpC family hydrolase/LysM repeat protein